MSNGKPTILSPKDYAQTLVEAQKLKEELSQPEGVIAELDAALSKVKGTVQQIDASFLSAGNAARQFFAASQKIFGSIVEQVINYDEAVRRTVTGNEKLTGTLISNRKIIQDLGKETSKFGVATSENLKVATDFGKQNIKLLSIYRDNIKGLVDYTARLSAFQVKSEDSIEIVNKLTTVLDLNGDQLDVSRRKLVSFATQTGQSVSEVMQSYSRSISSFMDFLNPEEMDKSFMQFQVMARRMGTEANQLYEMALKFDTLEGAQQTGARLNQTFSALGIEFNSLAVQDMEPQERIQYMADKTREALMRARQMGGKEGRLIMASLRESGLGSNEMIRALEAEGGGRRATDFEMGTPLGMLTREQEAAQARRLNFTRVDAAEAEERAQAAVRSTKTYQLFEESTKNFGGSVLQLSEAIAPLKQAYITAKAKKLDEAVFPSLQQALKFLTGGELMEQSKNFATGQGMANIKTISDLMKEINNVDPKKLETLVDKGFIGGLAKSFAAAIEEAAKKAGDLIKVGP